MPLIIDTKKCEGQDPELNFPVAVAMMVTGVASLKTEDDTKELYTRYLMYCVTHRDLDNRLTWEQVKPFTGAWANVSPYTKTQYNKRVAEWAREESDAILSNELEKAV